MATERLRRELGLWGAVVTGLGSILGTGAFVAIGVASAQWGDAVLYAIPLAGLVAVFNGLSSAFLAGRFPVAGGTYEYGYQTLGPWWGFGAGWLFLLAKTASASTAALGVTLYLGMADTVVVSIVVVGLMTGLVILGLRRTTIVNTMLVTTTVTALVVFTLAGLIGRGGAASGFLVEEEPFALLAAVAFLFVAYTGYGRIATLGEEVHDPERTIPRAVILTLAVSAGLYMGIALAGRSLAGEFWGVTLAVFGGSLLDTPWATIVAVGAVTAMLGVLLNLILGLSRVWLAMGRRRDVPSGLARLDNRSIPVAAILTTGVIIATVALVGDISLAWSFSAMTVLLYYGITNLAALKVDRRRWSGWAGLASCVFLSFFVPLPVWLAGGGILVLGLAWKAVYRPTG